MLLSGALKVLSSDLPSHCVTRDACVDRYYLRRSHAGQCIIPLFHSAALINKSILKHRSNTKSRSLISNSKSDLASEVILLLCWPRSDIQYLNFGTFENMWPIFHSPCRRSSTGPLPSCLALHTAQHDILWSPMERQSLFSTLLLLSSLSQSLPS